MSTEKENKTYTFVPPRRHFSVEFWVGVFALIGVGSFAYLALNIANIRLSDSGSYEIIARFDSVSGLEKGAPVELAGVQIGEVSDIRLKDLRAEVSLRLNSGTQLRDDDMPAIRTKGIIGDRYIKIKPGGSSEMIKSGGIIEDTDSAMEFEEVIGKMIHRFE